MKKHALAGRKQSPEHIARRVESVCKAVANWTDERRDLFRKRISETASGRTAWNKGKPFSDESCKRMSEAHIGIQAGENHPMFGKKMSPETKQKLLMANLGKKQSPEQIKNRFDSRAGYKHSPDTKLKIAIANTGEGNGQWKGGISKEPYPTVWSFRLRESIRERDNRECQICGKRENGKHHDVHHIDYNKMNIDPVNLISVCHYCHGKTNYNREKWQDFFLSKIRILKTGTDN
jgi:hypothetical protein